MGEEILSLGGRAASDYLSVDNAITATLDCIINEDSPGLVVVTDPPDNAWVVHPTIIQRYCGC